MTRPLALIDLDSTMADYVGAIYRDLKNIETPGEVYEYENESKRLPHITERVRLIRRQPNWWFNLEPLESGFKMVKLFQELGYDRLVLTRAPESAPNANTEKVLWTNKYLPGVSCSITPRKDLVSGAILFDDWPEYIEGWLKTNPNGLVIMPDWEWNRHIEHERVFRYTGDNLEQAREWLKRSR